MLKRNGEVFTTGSSYFRDADEPSIRISKVFVQVRFEGIERPLFAQLDTGADFSVLDRQVAEVLGVLDGEGAATKMSTRIGDYDGRLERVPISLVADEGESLEIDAVFFVSREWLGKTFLGYTGLLDHIRIALDPPANLLYFGPAG